MVKYIEELNQSHRGKYISCYMYNNIIEKALIYYCNRYEKFYILQNFKAGALPYDYHNIIGKKNEFKCSWGVRNGSKHFLRENNISKILLLDNQLIHELW
jgi:hypothetical protein